MSYSYDYLSRLSSSTFHNYSDAGVISGTNNYNENLTYDLRGNIQTLQRTGYYTNGSTCTYGQIDNLTYSYTTNTNRLHKVLDGTLTAGDAKSRGFNGLLSTVDNSMTYDRNGNLNKNLHKNVSTITYNHLNLPTVITFTTGNTIEFLYDAAGTKLRKTVKVGATVQYIQDYLPGGIEYRQTGTGVKRVESVFHAEGRYYNTNVDVSSTLAWRKEYNFQDYINYTRIVFTDRDANGVVDITGNVSTSDVLQENHYYGFGLTFEGSWQQNDPLSRDNAYKFLNREEQIELGMIDLMKRFYDPSISRFISVDPSPDVKGQESISPFQYAWNNPVLRSDPNGDCPLCGIVGAAAGAIIGGAIEAGTQLYQHGEIDNWNAVGGSAAQGAITGGVAGLTGGASLLTTVAISSGTNVVGGIVNNTIQGKEVTAKSVAIDAAVGAAAGVGGKILDKVIKNISSGAKTVIDEKRVGHIFRDSEGHIVKDTPAARKVIEKTANNSKNAMGADKYGNQWSAQTQKDGTQIWVQSRNGKVINAGVNKKPRTFNNETGLSSPTKSKQ